MALSYLKLLDQSPLSYGPWYLYVEEGSSSLVITDVEPSGIDITPTPTPSWIVANSPDGATWYAYPVPIADLGADLQISSTEPDGVGYLGSLQLQENNGPLWTVYVDSGHGLGITTELDTHLPRLFIWRVNSRIIMEVIYDAMNVYAAGDSIFLELRIKDGTLFPKPLFTPASGVTVTIRNPSGTAVVTNGVMTATGVGIFTYTHQTDDSDPLGVWTATFVATHGSHVGRTLPQSIFKLQ